MMSHIARLLAIAIALIAVAPGTSAAQQSADVPSVAGTLSFGGLERTYRVYRPDSLAHDAPVPLVVVLHGGYGTGAQAERAYGWDAAADAGRFVAVFPDGVKRSWNAGTCCGPAMDGKVDDVGFLTTLIAALSRTHNVDAHRIYVTGMSNGALMTYRLACDSPIAIAAIGPVAGTFAGECHGTRRTSVLAIHGSADTNVPYNGGLGGTGTRGTVFPPVASTIAWWRALDACDAPVSSTSGSVTALRSACANGRDVELLTITGAGHQWPGASPMSPQQLFVMQRLLGRAPSQPSAALNATSTLWAFFSTHRATAQ